MAVARWLIWTITKTHLASYRLLRGRFPGGRTFLLLTTTGRKSGKQRTVPLLFVRDGENYVVVGSNGGADWQPRWWLNLQSNPSALIQVGTERHRVIAEKASDVDRNRLWPELLKVYAGYDDYARNTAREIPVVLLKPAQNVILSPPQASEESGVGQTQQKAPTSPDPSRSLS